MCNPDPGNVVDFETLALEDQQLVRDAIDARELAFCPISKFKVGAALRTNENVTFKGCNIESVSFTPTVCAERTAICKGVSEGHLKFISVAVVAYLEDSFVAPCGVCRQMLAEFCVEDATVYLAKPDMDKVLRVKLCDLIPLAFTNY